MIANQTSVAWRRLGFYALVLLAFGLVSMVVFVVASEQDFLGAEDEFPEPFDYDPEKRPDFVFAESVRTFDNSLNRFIDRFARICTQAKYSEFRLMYTKRGRPAPAVDFEKMFRAVKHVEILAVEEIPQVPGVDGPVHIMLAEYTLEDYADRNKEGPRRIRLGITREEGQWRIGPIPGFLLEKLDAAQRASTSAPSSAAEPATPKRPLDAPAPRPTANRPARIESSGPG